MTAKSLGIPFLVALIYFGLAVFFLYRGHPYEDAYILFKYMDHLAQGRGFVYYIGGPRAEGFVDFLWVVGCGILAFLKWDVAVAAAFLNALGAGVAAFVFLKGIEKSVISSIGARLLLFLFCFLLLNFNGALAGYGGFSTLFYCGFVLLLFHFSARSSKDHVVRIPWLAILVALIRADGLILAAGFLWVGFYRAREMNVVRPYLKSCLAFLALGAAYFYWRLSYFGHLLPLPLYVKSAGGMLKGLPSSRDWLTHSSELPILSSALIAGWSLVNFRRYPDQIRNHALALLPILLYVASFLFAFQWQNEHFRFQAPVSLILIYLLFRISLFELKNVQMTGPRAGLIIIPLILVVAASVSLTGLVTIKNNILYRPLYLDTFAPLLAKRLGPQHTLAVSEAGRLAYWSRSRVEDMHGLNTFETSKNPPSPEYWQSIHPDFVLFQHAGTMEMNRWHQVGNLPVIPLEREELKQALKAECRSIFEHGLRHFRDTRLERLKAAMVLLAKYLYEENDFDFYAVKYWSRHRPLDYWHIYAFRKNLPEKEAILEDLRRVQAGFYEPYAKIKRFPFAGFWGRTV